MSSSKASPIANLALLTAGAIMLVCAGPVKATQFSGVIDTSAAFSPTNQSADGSTYFNAPASAPFSLVSLASSLSPSPWVKQSAPSRLAATSAAICWGAVPHRLICF